MSLLLDALKKAADDKDMQRRTLSQATHPEKNNSHHTLQDDESMELEFTDAENTNLAIETVDEFPEVDKTIINTAKADQPNEKINSDSNALGEAGAPTQAPFKAQPDEAIDNRLEPELEIIPQAAAESMQQGEPIRKDMPDEAAGHSTATDAENLEQQAIENEYALRALINKSNQHTRHEKLKSKLGLSLLVLLILVGSAIYFYIEMQTSKQDIFIAQNILPTEPDNHTLLSSAQAIKSSATNSPVAIKKQPRQQQQRVNIAKPAVRKSSLTAQPAATKKPITFIKKIQTDPLQHIIQRAYIAFNKSEFSKSQALYEQAIQAEASNRDALLGLAAIATKQKNFELARQKYLYLLKLNPRDTIATAGLSSIKNNISPLLNISQLKFMIKNQPDASHLYFALGSLYARQQQWAEAQSAYFNAWTGTSKNADYAYNLAVSLDHLNKPSNALQYYQISLQLKKAGGANFSTKDTRQRILQLQALAP